MHAPTVVAKGAGFVAQKIKAIAVETNEVPLVENKPLARTMFKQPRSAIAFRPNCTVPSPKSLPMSFALKVSLSPLIDPRDARHVDRRPVPCPIDPHFNPLSTLPDLSLDNKLTLNGYRRPVSIGPLGDEIGSSYKLEKIKYVSINVKLRFGLEWLCRQKALIGHMN
jgi:hypothetical protein